MLKRMDIVKLFKANQGRDYVFHECGPLHKGLNMFLDDVDEEFLMTKDDMYNNKNICYNIDAEYDGNTDTIASDLYNSDNFVIDLDNVWEWLGFTQKARAKNVLIKNFEKDKDYKIFSGEALSEMEKKGRGGHNKEVILMNVKTFNFLCLKGDTEKCHKIQKYYLKLERLVINSLKEEYKAMLNNTQVEDNPSIS
jgi:hypothetical protein